MGLGWTYVYEYRDDSEGLRIMTTVTGPDRSCHPHILSLSTTKLGATDLTQGSPCPSRTDSAVLEQNANVGSLGVVRICNHVQKPHNVSRGGVNN